MVEPYVPLKRVTLSCAALSFQIQSEQDAATTAGTRLASRRACVFSRTNQVGVATSGRRRPLGHTIIVHVCLHVIGIWYNLVKRADRVQLRVQGV